MYTMLILKEKTDKRVVYYYGVDEPDAPSDGEIECILDTKEFKTLKTATGDDDGGHAVWARVHVYRAIFKENCPQERFVACG